MNKGIPVETLENFRAHRVNMLRKRVLTGVIDKNKVTSVNIETDLVDIALKRTRNTWDRRQDSTTNVLEPGLSRISHEPPFRCQSVTNLSRA